MISFFSPDGHFGQQQRIVSAMLVEGIMGNISVNFNPTVWFKNCTVSFFYFSSGNQWKRSRTVWQFSYSLDIEGNISTKLFYMGQEKMKITLVAFGSVD